METINFLLNFQPIAYDCPAVDVRDVINQSSESAATLYTPHSSTIKLFYAICYLSLSASDKKLLSTFSFCQLTE